MLLSVHRSPAPAGLQVDHPLPVVSADLATSKGSGPLASAATPFVFLSPGDDLVAHGATHLVSAPQQQLAVAAATFFATPAPAAEPRLLVGAMPFDGRQPAYLICPDSVARVAPVAPVRGLPGIARSVVAEPSPADYRMAVTRALQRMRADGTSDLRKVVLSRRLNIEFDRPLDPLAIVSRLRSDPRATTFCVPLPAADGRSRVLVGATPELLIAKRGAVIQSSPLAGSARRSSDAASDRAAAEGLAHSPKDLREHAAVVEWIADTLSPHCRTLSVPSTPGLVPTATMWHLGTQIDGELIDPGMSSIDLVARLHPTPAVGGTPHDAALSAIAELEPFDRGFYGGVVGWCDAAGDGRWMVAIRCGELRGNTARVYAGAGIVAGSDPALETDETSAKLTTLLRALGVDESGRSLEHQP